MHDQGFRDHLHDRGLAPQKGERMTVQNPHKLTVELIGYVRELPVGITTAEVEAHLRQLLGRNGYEVPPIAVRSDQEDSEHEAITPFTLDPTVAHMSVGDVKILVDEALKEYVVTGFLDEAVDSVVDALTI